MNISVAPLQKWRGGREGKKKKGKQKGPRTPTLVGVNSEI